MRSCFWAADVSSVASVVPGRALHRISGDRQPPALWTLSWRWCCLKLTGRSQEQKGASHAFGAKTSLRLASCISFECFKDQVRMFVQGSMSLTLKTGTTGGGGIGATTPLFRRQCRERILEAWKPRVYWILSMVLEVTGTSPQLGACFPSASRKNISTALSLSTSPILYSIGGPDKRVYFLQYASTSSLLGIKVVSPLQAFPRLQRQMPVKPLIAGCL